MLSVPTWSEHSLSVQIHVIFQTTCHLIFYLLCYVNSIFQEEYNKTKLNKQKNREREGEHYIKTLRQNLEVDIRSGGQYLLQMSLVTDKILHGTTLLSSGSMI